MKTLYWERHKAEIYQPILSNHNAPMNWTRNLNQEELHFVRYADDCVIAVGSSAAANRVMHTGNEMDRKEIRIKGKHDQKQMSRNPRTLSTSDSGFVRDGG